MLLTLLALMAVLVSCVEEEPPEEPRGPHDATAELREDLMLVSHSAVHPGSRVELSFPEGTIRGLGFVLEEAVDDGWQLRYYLTSAPADREPSEPDWVPAADGEPGWDAVGISGPGPDVVVVPDTATDGNYRVCTATSQENHCTPLRVTSE